MRLTGRCKEILKLLRVARWLTTSQLHRRFFIPATLDASRKRMKTLVEGGYAKKVQPNRMGEALFTLGPEGKRLLERQGATAIMLERTLPRQLEHLLGVNDIRVAAELSFSLTYFFAYWELPGIKWQHPIIPDAVFGVERHSFAVGFDRGMENVRFFVRTKLSLYQRGLDGFSVHRVMVVTDRRPRLEALAKAIGGKKTKVVFTTLDLVREHGFTAPIFFESAHGEGLKLL